MTIPVEATITNSNLNNDAELEIQKQLELIQKMQDDVISSSNLNSIDSVITYAPPNSPD
jgi:hypothetical protein